MIDWWDSVLQKWSICLLLFCVGAAFDLKLVSSIQLQRQTFKQKSSLVVFLLYDESRKLIATDHQQA